MTNEQFEIIVERLNSCCLLLGDIASNQRQQLANQRKLMGDVVEPLMGVKERAEQLRSLAETELVKAKEKLLDMETKEGEILKKLVDKNEEVEATRLGPQ